MIRKLLHVGVYYFCVLESFAPSFVYLCQRKQPIVWIKIVLPMILNTLISLRSILKDLQICFVNSKSSFLTTATTNNYQHPRKRESAHTTFKINRSKGKEIIPELNTKPDQGQLNDDQHQTLPIMCEIHQF